MCAATRGSGLTGDSRVELLYRSRGRARRRESISAQTEYQELGSPPSLRSQELGPHLRLCIYVNEEIK